MAYVKLRDNVFDCRVCHTRCDGKSKGVYRFESDVQFSESYEQIIINRINQNPAYKADKTNEAGYPDIVIKSNGVIHRYLEVKVQRRTFMNIQAKLPNSGLYPSETVALNRSDLLRYFQIEDDTHVSTSIVWVLMERPCIVQQGKANMYYQTTKSLRHIYQSELNKRTFTRQSGEGDVVDGIHKGVIVNYHFSLNELKPWL